MRYLLVSDFVETKEYCLDKFESVSDKDMDDLIDFISESINTDPDSESTIRIEERKR